MDTTVTSQGTPSELLAEFQEAVDDLAKGIRRPKKMEAACEHMDRLREENRQLFGEQNIAVELIRQTRDEA
jgi:succinate dehydrogenase/fumarate reductase flavoprotein subunit